MRSLLRLEPATRLVVLADTVDDSRRVAASRRYFTKILHEMAGCSFAEPPRRVANWARDSAAAQDKTILAYRGWREENKRFEHGKKSSPLGFDANG
jgi:hypothetical protein